jgi:hypothetical protein
MYGEELVERNILFSNLRGWTPVDRGSVFGDFMDYVYLDIKLKRTWPAGKNYDLFYLYTYLIN